MSNTVHEKSRRGSRWLRLVLVIALLILAGAVLLYARAIKRDRGGTPELLNQPTDARVAKPFTDTPDNRFAPLPLEREKHDQ